MRRWWSAVVVCPMLRLVEQYVVCADCATTAQREADKVMREDHPRIGPRFLSCHVEPKAPVRQAAVSGLS